jgi:hypothetical protein
MAKVTNLQEHVAESPKPQKPTESPQAPLKKKAKRSDANKGILISENPPMPSMDDVSIPGFCLSFAA